LSAILPDDELTRRFAARQVANPETFFGGISCEDEMYLHPLPGYRGNVDRARLTYLLQGKQMLDQLRPLAEAWFGGWASVGAFLDFASGYGRFTRHLVQELPADRIVVSDIYEDAVRFQREHLGVTGIPSSVEPGEVSFDRSFDFIFVSSLFSHLPEQAFHAFMAKLLSVLADRGLLVFTTRAAEGDQDFVYRGESESRSLDPRVYGSTFASEAFVRRVLRSVHGDLQCRRIAHGHLGFQDLYLVTKSQRSLDDLVYRRGFFGHVGACWREPSGRIGVHGWAANLDTTPKPIEIEIHAGTKLLAQCTPGHDREDVAKVLAAPEATRSGWLCRVPADGVTDPEWISVEIVNHEGRRHVISLATLEAMLGW
jgi:SAM-dependent methyltransferase